MRRRRRMGRNYEKPNWDENLDLPKEDPKDESELDDSFFPELSEFSDSDMKRIIKCESNFFCEVIQRLSAEVNRANNLNDLSYIVSLATKFLEASAAKEKAVSCRMAAAKGICSSDGKGTDCVCDLEENEEEE